MKTLFVVSTKLVNNHVGEEYDVIMEVEHQPTVETISDWANRIRGRIRALWMCQVSPEGGAPAEADPKVLVWVDAASPFHAIVRNLSIIMKGEEGIIIELPYWDGTRREVTDVETLEVLNKLEGRKA